MKKKSSYAFVGIFKTLTNFKSQSQFPRKIEKKTYCLSIWQYTISCSSV